jgi:hypothetical protein
MQAIDCPTLRFAGDLTMRRILVVHSSSGLDALRVNSGEAVNL